MEETSELMGEPKNTFVNLLMRYNYQVEIMLYMQRVSGIPCIHALKGLINMLDEKSYKKLEELDKEIDRYLANVHLMKDRNQLYVIHRKIMHYLHGTYLREVRFARPKYKGSKLEV